MLARARALSNGFAHPEVGQFPPGRPEGHEPRRTQSITKALGHGSVVYSWRG